MAHELGIERQPYRGLTIACAKIDDKRRHPPVVQRPVVARPLMTGTKLFFHAHAR
jgi:hypothetical protein